MLVSSWSGLVLMTSPSETISIAFCSSSTSSSSPHLRVGERLRGDAMWKDPGREVVDLKISLNRRIGEMLRQPPELPVMRRSRSRGGADSSGGSCKRHMEVVPCGASQVVAFDAFPGPSRRVELPTRLIPRPGALRRVAARSTYERALAARATLMRVPSRQPKRRADANALARRPRGVRATRPQ